MNRKELSKLIKKAKDVRTQLLNKIARIERVIEKYEEVLGIELEDEERPKEKPNTDMDCFTCKNCSFDEKNDLQRCNVCNTVIWKRFGFCNYYEPKENDEIIWSDDKKAIDKLFNQLLPELNIKKKKV